VPQDHLAGIFPEGRHHSLILPPLLIGRCFNETSTLKPR
jgi:hypothetical protein